MSLPRFGVRRPVPVNLLMAALLLGGLASGLSLRREFFPTIKPEAAIVAAPYPGASPEEIEDTLIRKIEDRLTRLDEVDELRSSIFEGAGTVTVEFKEGVGNIDKAVDEVERAIDGLMDLPTDAEDITVTELEPRLPAIMVTIYGDIPEESLKRTIRAIRDDLEDLPGMGEVLVSGVRDYELRIDVDRDELLQHGISLPEVSRRIGAWLADIPGGAVRSETGNVSVRTFGVEEQARAIEDIIVKATPGGQAIRVGDIATVRRTFVDETLETRFNGFPSASLTIYQVGDQDIIQMADLAKAYVAGRRDDPFPGGLLQQRPNSPMQQAYERGLEADYPIPPGASITYHSDLARIVNGRLELLLENALYGAILVFGTLLLFLNWRGAFWVGVGLVTAMAGTLVLMVVFDYTLNLLTMFGLIVVIGLLVDDAIVVAENIQARHDAGDASLVAAIDGANKVAWPVVATVLTSIVAFLPLTFIRGSIGDMLGALPMVVAFALIMSLIESLLILPSHIGHSLVKRDRKQPGRSSSMLRRFEARRDRFIFNRVIPGYERLLRLALHYRYMAVALATAFFIVSIGFVAGGRLVYVFLPDSDAETVMVDISLPVGAPVQATRDIVQVIEEAARAQPEVNTISSTIGQSANIETGRASTFATHIAQMFIELEAVEQRDRASNEIITGIREAIQGDVDRAERVVFSGISGGPAGADISIQLRSADEAQVNQLTAAVKDALHEFAGVFDIADDNTLGQKELQISLKPGAAALGFTVADVALQVRGALFGIDAHVYTAEEEDIDVRVRLDEPTRRSLHSIETLWLVNPAGDPVPLSEVADISEGTGYATIRRVDRQRAVTVTANTSPAVSPEDIVNALPIDQWRAEFPGVVIDLTGRQEQQMDAFATLPLGFLAAMIMIYIILAWLFSSYVQPLAVMLGVPFSIIGVIWGHWLLGYELTFLSLIGFVALSGIVVNDSLILVKFYNDMRERGTALVPALLEAGRRRFRPIFLTTITTVLGLTPLMLEQSFQAKFLIPMAIAIAFGLMSATVLILLLLPCILVIFDDVKAVTYFTWHGRPRPAQKAVGQESVLDVVTEP